MFSDPLPLPPSSFDRRPLVELWIDPIIRVHHSRFGASEFNPGLGEGGRFDPVHEDSGAVVPTLYGASTFPGALAESIFRKVPVHGDRRLRADALMPLQASTLQASRALRLIDLRGFGLQRLGISRRELIDSGSEHYPITRKWAAALYTAVENADGMIWIARQHDLSAAILLFGTRVDRHELEVITSPRPLAPEGSLDAAVIIAAEAAGIMLVPPS